MSRETRTQRIISDLNAQFANSKDVRVECLKSPLKPSNDIVLVYCDGQCDTDRLMNFIIPELRTLLFEERTVTKPDKSLWELKLPPIQVIGSHSEVPNQVFKGKVVVFWYGFTYAIDVEKRPNRYPEDSNMDISLLGGRDGFIEDLVTNVALVRKRLNSLSLSVDKFQAGKLGTTAVAVLYLDGKVRKSALKEVQRQLQTVEVEAVESGTEFVEMLSGRKYAFLPKYRYSGRPDFVARCLRRGKFALLIDGMPSALIAPISLSFLLTAADDAYNSFPFVVLEHVLRYIAFVIALFVPGFYVAITALHPDQVPLALLATLVNSRTGLPIPTPIEAFVMLLLFEIFKESGTHLPQPAGNTLSVVGGLIIGDAAIRAGIASPALVVIISASAVSLYAITNHALAGAVSILRFGILVMSSIFGLYGFILSSIFITTYFAHVRSFGEPFYANVSPFSWKKFKQTFISSWPRGRRVRQ